MNHQHKYLFIAIIIPILMIVIVAFSLFIPIKKITPKYNFLYAMNDRSESFTCLQNIMAKFFPKTMNINFYKIDPGMCKRIQLYIYDFSRDSTQSITFEQAKKLNLKENLNSDTENIYISRNCYNGPDLGLWSMRSTDEEVCLVKGDYKQLVNIDPEHTKQNFIFIGWILSETAIHQEKTHE